MHHFTVAIVRGRLAGNALAEAHVLAVVFFDLNVAAAGMRHAIDKTHGPVVSVSVDIHGISPYQFFTPYVSNSRSMKPLCSSLRRMRSSTISSTFTLSAFAVRSFISRWMLRSPSRFGK